MEPHISANYDWEAYHNGNPLQKYWKRRIARTVKKMIGTPEPGSTIVDLGCGSSPLLKSMTEFQVRIGLDTDASKIDFMQKADTTSRYFTGSGMGNTLLSDVAHTSMSIEVLEHLDTPQELLAELARITKPGGRIIVATPDFGSLRWNLIEILYGLLMRNGYHCEHFMKFTESSLIAIASIFKLEHVQTKKIWGADMVMEFRKL